MTDEHAGRIANALEALVMIASALIKDEPDQEPRGFDPANCLTQDDAAAIDKFQPLFDASRVGLPMGIHDRID